MFALFLFSFNPGSIYKSILPLFFYKEKNICNICLSVLFCFYAKGQSYALAMIYDASGLGVNLIFYLDPQIVA